MHDFVIFKFILFELQHEMFEIFIEDTFEFDEKIYCFPD